MRLSVMSKWVRSGALCGIAIVMGQGQIAPAAKLPEAIGREGGLCVIIGCGTAPSAAIAADLAASGKMLVHGIALDDAALARARQAIGAKGVDGLATVEKLPVKGLPYRDNLANVVVVPDFKSATAAGLAMAEAMRVVVPEGKLCVYRDGMWNVTVKPRPAEMDEWTHAAHGPDGNRVSTDTIVKFPVGLRWNDGLPLNIRNPKQGADAWSNTRGMALTGGRCLVLSSLVRENLGPMYASPHGTDHYITARDAYNGLFLWRTRVGAVYYGGLFLTNRAPFLAAGDGVYTVTEKGDAAQLDAATGRVAKTFDTTYFPGRMLLDRNTLVVATWHKGSHVGAVQGVDRRRMEYDIAKGTVEAFDVTSGKRLWLKDKLANSLRAADGVVYMLAREGADPVDAMTARRRGQAAKSMPTRPKQSVLAVDLRTGSSCWEVSSDVLGAKDHLRLDVVGQGVVTVSHNNGVKTSVLSATDGKLITQIKRGSYAALYQGKLHVGGLPYDLKTGKQAGKSGLSLGRTICTPRYFVNNILVNSRGCSYLDNGKWVRYGAARGACLFAAVAANGAFYTAQNWCCCAPGQVPGFISFGPIGHVPSAEDMEKAPVVERGPAFGKTSGTPGKDDWPMCRHDAQRTSATSSPAPAKLDLLWQTTITQPATGGLVVASWDDSLMSPLTAPVVAEGVMVAAATNRHQVVALDAASGKELWRAKVGARVDTPPTIHKGVCLVGSHDGWVYALGRKDGRLAWKMHAAPEHRRMVSYGQVESPWPVIGTVLVADGVGYASAGRTSESDGGIVVRAFEPATGKVIWSHAILPPKGGREQRQNDLMLKVGNAIQLMVTRMDPRTGALVKNPTREYQIALRQWHSLCWRRKREKKPLPEKPKAPAEIAPSTGLEGFICWTWTRVGSRRAQSMALGNVAGSMLSWGDQVVCANRGGSNVRAVVRDKIVPQGDKPKPTSRKWAVGMPAGHQVTSMAVCKDAVVLGGGIYGKKATTHRGFVWVVSLDKGQKTAERTFDAPLAYNGIAVAGGKVYATFVDGTAVCLGTK